MRTVSCKCGFTDEYEQVRLEDDIYEAELNKYLNEGINYTANTIKNADVGDLQQLAADSFFYGYLLAVKRFKNGW